MPNINITVREKIAHTIGNPHIVCGNSDYVVHFDFDAEWDAYETKTARFIWGGKYTDVLFEGTECPVPVIMDAYGVLVGVYAGELHTTTVAAIDTDKSILSGNATESEASTEMWESVDAVLRKKIDAPQVAQVGEVLTVEAVDADGKPTKWKTAPAAAEQKQADWAQNDETAADYVKNRPFYNEEIPYTIIAQAVVPATSERVLFGNINEMYAKALNDNQIQKYVNAIVVNGVKIAAEYTGSSSWYQYYDTAIFKGGDIVECRVSKQQNVVQLTMNDASDMTFEVGTKYTIIFLNASQSSYTYHTIGADYIPIGSGLNVKDGRIVSSVGQKYLEGKNEDAGDVFNDISNNIASGHYSHAEGYSVTASGDYGSHAEGYRTVASKRSSHAEGDGTSASGEYSHAEGSTTIASGLSSHAEGYGTVAKGIDAHAEGRYTIASAEQQHVQGRSNIEDTKGVYAHIVGNGDSNNKRSNAHTLDWDGNAWFSGDVYVGSTSGTNKDDGSKKLVTEDEVSKCHRITIIPTQSDDGTITYDSNYPASYIYHIALSDGPILNGNSIECAIMPIDGQGALPVLNYTGMSLTRNNDGSVGLAFEFSSYVSGKHISAEIKDTISGFRTDDEEVLSTVVTVTESASLPTPTTAQPGQIVRVKSVDESGKITETEADDLDYVKNYYSWNEFKPELQAGQRPEIVMLSNQSHGADDNVPSHAWVYPCVLYFSRQGNTSYSYLMVGADGSTYEINYSHTKGNFSIVKKRLNIPSPETVLVGQIIKVKTIRDGSGGYAISKGSQMGHCPLIRSD